VALTNRPEWKLFAALPKADAALAAGWWAGVFLRGVLPAVFAIATGSLVAAVQQGRPLGKALLLVGVVFVLLQVLGPIHTAIGANLGDRLAAWLYDRLTESCVTPAGVAHLEDPALTGDLTMARDFDLGMMGPPLSISMDFIAGGLVEFIAGVASAAILFAFTWWAPLVLGGAWLATHRLLSDSAIWHDRNTPEVRAAQRDAEYAYRIAVDPPASKELRLFGLDGWTLDRFVTRRTLLHRLQYEATRIREQPLLWSILLVTAANVLVFWAIAAAVSDGAMPLGRAVVFVQAAIGASLIAFGGLNWALDGGAAPVAAVLRLRDAMAALGTLRSGTRLVGDAPAREIRFRDVTFAYPGGQPILDHFDLTIPAGSSLAIVGQNGAGKTTIAKLLCRLYDPQSGAIEADGVDVRDFDIAAWRAGLTAVFQYFIRFERPLRQNVAPSGAPDEVVRDALEAAGAAGLADLETVLARGYDGGTDLSGGQWQRVALARALCAVRQGARVVLLDEPTAQLDVRGEAEIFDRILRRGGGPGLSNATRNCTTILISHRFSTVRHADRICVLEHGRVVELGSHYELMQRGGRYKTMFDLQASRFTETDEEGAAFEHL